MSIFFMGSGEWGVGNGDWGVGNGDSGIGGSGMGTRELRIGSRQRTTDVGTSCPLTAFRFPNLLTIFFK